jgi:hypothetical protein
MEEQLRPILSHPAVSVDPCSLAEALIDDGLAKIEGEPCDRRCAWPDRGDYYGIQLYRDDVPRMRAIVGIVDERSQSKVTNGI